MYQAMPAVSPPNMLKDTLSQNSRNTASSKTAFSSLTLTNYPMMIALPIKNVFLFYFNPHR